MKSRRSNGEISFDETLEELAPGITLPPSVQTLMDLIEVEVIMMSSAQHTI